MPESAAGRGRVNQELDLTQGLDAVPTDREKAVNDLEFEVAAEAGGNKIMMLLRDRLGAMGTAVRFMICTFTAMLPPTLAVGLCRWIGMSRPSVEWTTLATAVVSVSAAAFVFVAGRQGSRRRAGAPRRLNAEQLLERTEVRLDDEEFRRIRSRIKTKSRRPQLPRS